MGGNNSASGQGIAVDSSGYAYIAGFTTSTNFPTTVGAFQTTLTGSQDAFMTKLNPAGGGASDLLYSTYLGGSNNDNGNGIAIDGSGYAYITGSTQSINFPTTVGAFQTTLTGSQDAFMTKLNPAGGGSSDLLYSTYLGGSNNDNGNGIAIDGSGYAYITGSTQSINFPTTVGAFQTTLTGSQDAFMTKLNPAGGGASDLLYSTYLGGSNNDNGNGIAIDGSGYAYITGSTQSINFPTTVGAFQTTLTGNTDAFITKLNPAGGGASDLFYSTYLGGNNTANGRAIAIDSRGNAYIIGGTSSTNFPTTVGAFQTTLAGTSNAVISKLAIGTPVVSSLSPSNGPIIGGTTVTITGINFMNATAVYFGGTAASFNIDSDTQITATSPAHALGAVHVVVIAPGGTSQETSQDLFTYVKISTTTSLTITPNPSTFGQNVNLTATLSTNTATGNVNFFEGGTLLATVPVTSGTAVFTTSSFNAGSHTLTAVYSGDANFSGSTSAPVTLIVNQASTTASLTVTPNPSTFGQNVNLTATLSTNTATGNVNFFEGGTLLATVPVTSGTAVFTTSSFNAGSHTLTAVYSGDANFSGSTSAPVTLIVNQASTTTSLTVTPNPSTFGQNVNLTATLSTNTATGNINFFEGGTLLATVPVTSGTAVFTTSSFNAGSHTLTAVYSGDANFSGSTSAPVTLIVNQASTTASLTVTPNPSTFGQNVNLTATLSTNTATGNINFFEGGTLLATIPVTNGTAVFTTSSFNTGSHTLTAVYNGDANFSGSTSAPVTLNIISSNLFLPIDLQGFQTTNRFATQTDTINVLKWKAPLQSSNIFAYRIYRHRSLTKLVTEIPADKKLQFEDHHRKKGKTYTYYIVSVDQLGNMSVPAKLEIKK